MLVCKENLMLGLTCSSPLLRIRYVFNKLSFYTTVAYTTGVTYEDMIYNILLLFIFSFTCSKSAYIVQKSELQVCNFSENWGKVVHCAIIRYFFVYGLSPKEIHKDMVATLCDNVPPYNTVKNWAVEFKQGREILHNDPSEGRSPTTTTKKYTGKIHDIIMADRRLTTTQRGEVIYSNLLEMTKVSAWWVKNLFCLIRKDLGTTYQGITLLFSVLIQRNLYEELPWCMKPSWFHQLQSQINNSQRNFTHV